MADDKYKILERVTTGWHLIANNADELTKEECDRMLKELVDQGQNPNDLKAVAQDDPRYPTEKPDPGYIPTKFIINHNTDYTMDEPYVPKG